MNKTIIIIKLNVIILLDTQIKKCITYSYSKFHHCTEHIVLFVLPTVIEVVVEISCDG